MTLDELQVLITANTNGLRTEIGKAQNSLTSLSKTSDKTANAVTKGFNFIKASVVGVGITALLNKITGGMDDAISRVDTLNNYTNVMGNLGVGSSDAESSINRLSEALIGLPTTLDDAALSVQRFTSANGNVKASTEMFLALNNAILAGGASTQTQATAIEQLSQAYAKGKPDMVEWRAALTAMPAQLNQVAKAMGYTDSTALGEALTNGKVSMNEFMVVLTKLNKEGVDGFQSFEEQARNATGGIATSITNVKTAFTRGLANIMDAIGQSNIAGFFQNIAKAINNVVPYITAFVKVCATAVSYITSLFGGKTKTNIDKTSTALSNLGTSAGTTTSSGLDSASDSAKKLNKELNGLASFDEMNVLSENNANSGSSSGGSSNTGDLGSIDMSAFDTTISDATSKLDEIYDKMLNSLKWFTSDMDFQPLVNSFKNLGDAIDYFLNGSGGLLKDFIKNYLKPLTTWTINTALPDFFNSTANAIKQIDFNALSSALNNLYTNLEPFSENVGNGLLWFYKEVLIPLGLWTVNKVVPEFITSISNGIGILNNTIDVAKPVLNFLWQDFLSPIAKWTGGMVVTVLKDLNSVLGLIAKSKVASTIVTMTAGFKLLTSTGNVLQTTLAKINETMSTKSTGLTGLLKSALKGVNNFLTPTKTLVKSIKNASTVTGDYTDALGGMILAEMNGQKKTISLKSAFTTFTTKLKSAKTEVSNFTTKLSNGIQTWYNTSSAVDKLKTGVTGLAGTVVSLQGFSSAMKDISTSGANFGNVTTSVVSGIGSIASAAMSGASVGGVYGAAIGGIASAIGLVVTGLSSWGTQNNTTAALLESTSEIYNTYHEKMKSINSTLQSTISTSQQDAEVKLAEISNAQALSSELENYIDVNGRVKQGYEDRASVIMGVLNEALGTNLTLEGNTIKNGNELISTKQQYINVINQAAEAIKKQTLLESYQAQYKAAIEAQIEAKKAYNQVMQQEQEELDKAVEKYKKHKILQSELQEIYEASSKATEKAEREYQTTLDDTNGIINGLDKVSEAYAKGTSADMKKTIEEITKTNSKSTDEIKSNYEKSSKSVENALAKVCTYQGTLKEQQEKLNDKVRSFGKITAKASLGLDTSQFFKDYNKAVDKITKYSGGKVTGFTKIPGQYATGGVFDKPTMGIIGEDGAEAVMPLEKNTGWIDKLASDIVARGGAGNNNSNQPIQIVVKLGEDTIFNKFYDDIKAKQFESNGEVFI